MILEDLLSTHSYILSTRYIQTLLFIVPVRTAGTYSTTTKFHRIASQRDTKQLHHAPNNRPAVANGCTNVREKSKPPFSLCTHSTLSRTKGFQIEIMTLRVLPASCRNMLKPPHSNTATQFCQRGEDARQTKLSSTSQQPSSHCFFLPSSFIHLSSHQRRPGKHRQRLRALSRHHARRGRRRRGNAGPQGQRRRNERARAGGQGQGSSHLELHGCIPLDRETDGARKRDARLEGKRS